MSSCKGKDPIDYEPLIKEPNGYVIEVTLNPIVENQSTFFYLTDEDILSVFSRFGEVLTC